MQVYSGTYTSTTIYLGAPTEITILGAPLPPPTSTIPPTLTHHVHLPLVAGGPPLPPRTQPFANETWKMYYAVGNQMIAVRSLTSTGSVLNYLHSDHLNSTSLATDAVSGAAVPNSRQMYYPYGEPRVKGTSLPTNIGFTGQRLDATGLMFYGARYYSSGLGRFISADTVVPGAGNPQAWNRYAYVYNNPIIHIDPTGHCDPDERECPYSNPNDMSDREIQQLAGDRTRTPQFTVPPADPAAYTDVSVNGFGNTRTASNNRGWYGRLGYIHSGIDIEMPKGTTLVALDYGTVEGLNLYIGAGETSIVIRHGNKLVVYGHNASVRPGIKAGTRVMPGTPIGTSGVFSQNQDPHLHLEVRDQSANEFSNPLYFFTPEVIKAMGLKWQPYVSSAFNSTTMVSYNRLTTRPNPDGSPYGNFWNNTIRVQWNPVSAQGPRRMGGPIN